METRSAAAHRILSQKKNVCIGQKCADHHMQTGGYSLGVLRSFEVPSQLSPDYVTFSFHSNYYSERKHTLKQCKSDE